MGPSVEVVLNNRRMYVRFGLRNSRLATSGLQGALPAGSEKLTINKGAQLVFANDQDAVLVYLWHGLRAGENNDRLTFDTVEAWLEKEIVEKERDMSEFSLPILEALKGAKLITLNYKGQVEEQPAEGAERKGELGSYVEDDPLRRRGLELAGGRGPLSGSPGETSRE